MALTLKDKVALVTGAGGGIGRSVAQRFAREGATVVCADIDGEHAMRSASEITQSGGTGWGECVDISSEAHVNQLTNKIVDAHGRIDVLVHAAGWG